MKKQIETSKKEYLAPRIEAQGNVEKVTLEGKDYGISDGFLFQGGSGVQVS